MTITNCGNDIIKSKTKRGEGENPLIADSFRTKQLK